MNNNRMNPVSLIALVLGVLGIIVGGIAIFLGMQETPKLEKKLADIDAKASSLQTEVDKLKKDAEGKENTNKANANTGDTMLPTLQKVFAELSKEYQEDQTKFIEGNGISIAKLQKEFLDEDEIKTTLTTGKWAFTVNNNQIHLTYTSNNAQETPLNYALEINGVAKQFTVKSLNTQTTNNTNTTNTNSTSANTNTNSNASSTSTTNTNSTNNANSASTPAGNAQTTTTTTTNTTTNTVASPVARN